MNGVPRERPYAAIGRDDLILPIYYLNADPINGAYLGPFEEEVEEREVAAPFRAHQYEDWRTLREASETDPAYAKAIERLAQKAVGALRRSPAMDRKDGPPERAQVRDAAPQEPQRGESLATPPPRLTRNIPPPPRKALRGTSSL
jgi:hypothetical protein